MTTLDPAAHLAHGLTEPVPAPLQRLLRRELIAAASLDTQRRFPVTLQVGLPGSTHVLRYDDTLNPSERLDHALRTDLALAMLQAIRSTVRPHHPLIWLRRPGPLTPLRDADLAWLAAADQAHDQVEWADRPELIFLCLNRTGWRDPRSGVGRRWKRLPRPRHPAPAP